MSKQRKYEERSPETVAFLREVADLFKARGYSADVAEVMGYIEVWKSEPQDVELFLDAAEVTFEDEVK